MGGVSPSLVHVGEPKQLNCPPPIETVLVLQLSGCPSGAMKYHASHDISYCSKTAETNLGQPPLPHKVNARQGVDDRGKQCAPQHCVEDLIRRPLMCRLVKVFLH